VNAATFWPVAAAAAGSALGGTAAVAARYLGPEADPVTVAFLRYLGAITLLLIYARLAHLRMPRIAPRDWPAIVLMGVLQFALFGWLFSAGFTLVPAGRGALVLATMPLQTLALATLLRREVATPLKTAGVLLGFLGVAIALADGRNSFAPTITLGDIYLLGAGFVCALNSVLCGPYLMRYGTHPMMVVTCGVGCAILGVIFVASGGWSELGRISASGWMVLGYMTCGPTLFAFLAWTWALGRVSPTSVTITMPFNPIAAALVGAVVLAEPIDIRLVMGVIVVTAAIAMVTRSARPRATAVGGD
jgi:drug/metabolite transporter (DMT)-like permease